MERGVTLEEMMRRMGVLPDIEDGARSSSGSACSCGPCSGMCAVPPHLSKRDAQMQNYNDACAEAEEARASCDEVRINKANKKRDKVTRQTVRWINRNFGYDFHFPGNELDGVLKAPLVYPRIPMDGEEPGSMLYKFQPVPKCSKLDSERGCKMSRDSMLLECTESFGMDHREGSGPPVIREDDVQEWNEPGSPQFELLRLAVRAAHEKVRYAPLQKWCVSHCVLQDSYAMPISDIDGNAMCILVRLLILSAVEHGTGCTFTREEMRGAGVQGNWSIVEHGVIARLCASDEARAMEGAPNVIMDSWMADKNKMYLSEYSKFGKEVVEEQRRKLQEARTAQIIAEGTELKARAAMGDISAQRNMVLWQQNQVHSFKRRRQPSN